MAVLPDEYRKRLMLLDEQIGDLYKERRVVLEEFASQHPAVLPPARARTDKQQLVARCPRCGGKIPNE